MRPVTMVNLPTTKLLGVVDYFGTENANDETAVTFEDRAQRCYELAGYAVALGDAPRGSFVVHGSWHGPEAEQRIGHAWVEFRGASGELLVWEPVTAAVYDGREFLKATRAWEERRYDAHTARVMIYSHHHYGRWHESRYP